MFDYESDQWFHVYVNRPVASKVQGWVTGWRSVSEGFLTVWWPWDRSCFSVSLSLLWCTCTDLAFWMIAGRPGSGSGGCCPWWSLWPSCDIRWCRCPGGQVVCPPGPQECLHIQFLNDLHLYVEVLSFGRLFLADEQSLRIELWSVSGPEVNIIVHTQTPLKTRAINCKLPLFV